LTNEPEPRYNYEDYQYEVKRQVQEAQSLARHNLLEAKNKSKTNYDRTSNTQKIVVGNKVLVHDKTSQNKLCPKWLGPFEVLEIDPNNTNLTIKRKKKRQKVHLNLVKPFFE